VRLGNHRSSVNSETQNSRTMKIQREDTAIVFTDPRNEVLGEKGLGWPLVRESLQENNKEKVQATDHWFEY
jgi:hypothetical protein